MFKKKIIFNLILIFSIFVLFAAYYIEYVLKHQPCTLCLIERIPYILAIIVTTISLFFKKFEKIYLILLCLIFISSTLLSLYHFGIEQGLIKESRAFASRGLLNDGISAWEILLLSIYSDGN